MGAHLFRIYSGGPGQARVLGPLNSQTLSPGPEHWPPSPGPEGISMGGNPAQMEGENICLWIPGTFWKPTWRCGWGNEGKRVGGGGREGDGEEREEEEQKEAGKVERKLREKMQEEEKIKSSLGGKRGRRRRHRRRRGST